MRALDGKLIDSQPIVFLRVRPIDQAHEIASRFTILLVLDGDATDQELVKMAIRRKRRRDAEVDHLLESILPGGCRHTWIELVDSLTKPEHQLHLAVMGACRVRSVMRNVRTIEMGVTHILQPGQGLLFELVFCHSLPPELFFVGFNACADLNRRLPH